MRYVLMAGVLLAMVAAACAVEDEGSRVPTSTTAVFRPTATPGVNPALRRLGCTNFFAIIGEADLDGSLTSWAALQSEIEIEILVAPDDELEQALRAVNSSIDQVAIAALDRIAPDLAIAPYERALDGVLEVCT